MCIRDRHTAWRDPSRGCSRRSRRRCTGPCTAGRRRSSGCSAGCPWQARRPCRGSDRRRSGPCGEKYARICVQHQYLSSLLSGSLAAGVAAERAGRHELAQLVTDHVLGDVHADVTAAVMHSEGVTDEGREDRRAAGPGLEDLFLAGFVQFIDSLELRRGLS